MKKLNALLMSLFMATSKTHGAQGMISDSLDQYRDFGLLLLRVGIGLMFTIAVTSIIRGGYGISAAYQPLVLGIVLLSLLFTCPGRLTLPKLLTSIRAAR